jgi:all-trans-retinol 13,14-reductase
MNPYDIVIIGSGMGSLVTGAILAKEGFRVCILEKNRQIGGALQTYVRDKVIFDSGVHYLGGLSPGQNLYQIFKYLGLIEKMKLQKMDEDCFDKIIFNGDDTEYNFAQGHENFIRVLLKYFPKEEKALREYIAKIKEVCACFPLYNLRTNEFFEEKANVLEFDTRAFIDSLTTDQKLRDVLAGNNSLYAGIPDKTPFYIHALVLNSYLESSWKCLDGGSQIARLLGRTLREHGGEIRRNCQVNRIRVKDGKAECAELSDGSLVYGKNFISGIHPAKTMELIEPGVIKNVYRNRLKSLDNSISSFTLNIVFKKEAFRYFKYNYYCHDPETVWSGIDYKEEDWPSGYAVFIQPSSRSTEFAQGMTVLAYMRYEEVEKWKDTFNTVSKNDDRGPEYETFKKEKAEKLLDKLELKFPGLRNTIRSYYTGHAIILQGLYRQR